MILNEDYFNDIDIKNDDLESGETGLYNDTHKNKDMRTLIKDMFSSYKHCLLFTISIPQSTRKSWNLFDKTTEWNFCRTVIKRMYHIFDAYDIKYSEPFFCTNYDFVDIYNKTAIYDYFPNFINKNLNIIDIENNRVIIDTDKIEKYKQLEPENDLSMFMFVNLPEFSTLKKSYRFIYSFAHSLQNMLIGNSDVVVYYTNKDNQRMSSANIFLNDTHIKNIMKGKIQCAKDSILSLVSRQCKYRKEFKKAETDIELQDFIKNH